MGKRSKDPLQYERKKSRRLDQNAPYPYPTEKSTTLLMFRLAFATFLISTATAATSDPSFFTIRGCHKWSLSLHLCMKPREFSALLIGCDLVNVTKTTGGGVNVALQRDKWDNFLLRYVNKGEPAGSSICEVTHKNTIYINALRDGAQKTTRNLHDNNRQMSLLRVGGYDVNGERTNPTLQINGCNDPPGFYSRLRSAHRALTTATMPFLDDILFGDDIEHVITWLEMKDVLGYEEDEDDDSDKKMPATKPPPPTPSLPNNNQPSTDPTPSKTEQTTTTNNITPPTIAKTKSLPPPSSNLKGGEQAYNKLTDVGVRYDMSNAKQQSPTPTYSVHG